MTTTQIVITLILNIPLFMLIGWVIFDSWENFLNTLFLGLRSGKGSEIRDLRAAMRGEQGTSVEERFSFFTLLIYVVCCAAFVTAEYKLILPYFFPDLLPPDAGP